MNQHNHINNSNSAINIDFALLVPTLYLAEALIKDYRLKKSLIRLLDHVITLRPKLGKVGLLNWLKETGFSHTKDIEKILVTTPLGNPAWGLLSHDPLQSQKLIKDLESYTLQIEEPKSLKTLIKEFLIAHPQYGTTKQNQDSYTTFYVSNRWQAVGDITTRLMLLQMAATPKSKRQLYLEGQKHVEGDDYPIHRPDPILYKIALRDLLIGSASLDKDAWDEMVSLYQTRSLTNFLSFAPLLLQPFVTSDYNIPSPSINTLATLMGDFTGIHGTFMGEITRSGLEVKWEKLGLTIGKLCEKNISLSPVTAHETVNNTLNCSLKNTYKVCGDISETPTLGQDQGWVVLGEHLLANRWNIKLIDINNSIKNKIQFYKFTKARGSLVFNTPTSLTCLDYWSREQVKQSAAWRLLGGTGGLPSSRDLITGMYSVFPRLTYIIRSEQESIKSLRKYLSGAAFEAEAKTNTCIESEFNVETCLEVTPMSVLTGCADGGEPSKWQSWTKSTDCPPDDGISKFFIAETYQEERYKKESISKLRLQISEPLKRKDLYYSMRDEDLYSLIDRSFGTDSHAELQLAFEELIERKLGVYVGSVNDEPVNFRYYLGDEEVVAVEEWFNNEEEDYVPALPATRAVNRVRVALTFIYLAKYLHSNNKKWSYDQLWQFEIFKKYPLIEEEKHAVYSLIPILYWVYTLGKDDPYRVKKPDMFTPLFVPTARISSSLYDVEDEDKLEIKDVYLPKPLSDVRVSSLSLCSITDWKPENILNSASSFFGISYSHSRHPNETKYVRLYVKLAVDTLLKRLSSVNLMSFVSSISFIPHTIDETMEVFKSLREQLKCWYQEFSTDFRERWTLLGDDWVSFENLDKNEVNVYNV